MQENPIAHLMDDQQFRLLEELNLLNKKLLRDLEIRRKYHALKQQGIQATEAIQLLLVEYPYLQYDTIRKLVYSRAVIRIEHILMAATIKYRERNFNEF